MTEKREERRAEWLPFVLGATPIQVALDAIAKATNAPAEMKMAPVREPFSDDLVVEFNRKPNPHISSLSAPVGSLETLARFRGRISRNRTCP